MLNIGNFVACYEGQVFVDRIDRVKIVRILSWDRVRCLGSEFGLVGQFVQREVESCKWVAEFLILCFKMKSGHVRSQLGW